MLIRATALAFAIALVAGAGASAEVVARGVEDGQLALSRTGTPSVAFVRGTTLFIATRSGPGRWKLAKAATVNAFSNVMAFTIGPSGAVALVQSADDRRLVLVRRHSVGWQTIPLVRRLGAPYRLGWPGLAVGRRGGIHVAYTRWNAASLDSRLLLARIDAKGRVRTERITFEGFPKSIVPPPAVPVVFGGQVHVIESYGYRGVLGTLEWYPDKRTWTGLNLDAGVGDFPLGPVLAGLSPAGVLHAAWTESLASFGTAPVTLANRGREASSEFVLDRALATSLALPSSGPEVAANEWVGAEELGRTGDQVVWAGMIARGRERIELDGWLADLAVTPRGGRDLLLGSSGRLSWFHAAQPLVPRVSIEAVDDGDGVSISGTVRAVSSGSVALYRERPGEARKRIARPSLVGGAFSFVDAPGTPAVYRAVWVDRKSGIPYAALSRP
jgi:hypothetical protein